ncbi:MAG: C25 family cysteine peptidase [Bacteroidales bacterium]|jgi:PKD repeat protein|nr:C25 family cysteine peptidase [Bacteroidales bacterium]
MKTLPFTLKLGATLICCLILVFQANAQEVRYSNSWTEQGFDLQSSSQQGVHLMHSVNSFRLGAVTIKGEDMKLVHMPGNMLPNQEGAPDLPGQGRYIAIPQGAKANLNIVRMRVETIDNVNIAPAPHIPFEDDDSPLKYEKDQSIYSKDDFYPAEPVALSQPSKIRGVDVVMLGITPFQYNPVSKQLKVLRDIELEITFEGGNGHFGEDRYRSRWWDPILADAILNFDILPAVDPNLLYNTKGGDGCEYLIITADDPDYVYWADSIATFRNKQGILTEVVTLTEVGGNNTSTIESFVDNAYTNWTVPPAAVLLIGDFGPNQDINILSPIYNSYCASDNIYADVDGDHLPEMAFGRITANDSAQVAVMVTKFLDHETNPPTNPAFYDNPITAIGWQSTRWFQLCGEVVGGFWKNIQGKNPVRINDIYSGTPGSSWSSATNTATVVDYFGPNGLGYIPAQPNILGGWTGGNATMINNTINDGSFIMLHRDHGSTSGWGEPSYNSSSINGLTNTDLIFVMSINCLTGKYNMSGECFAEKFHRYTYDGENSGALGITAASEVSYSFVNDTYVWGFIDNMWPDFMPDYGTAYPRDFALPAFGNAAGKIFLEQSNWPYNTSNKQVTYHLFHHHGGTFLNLYSEVPVNLTVDHGGEIIYGSSSFEITADDGSLICLYYDGEIVATATGTGVQQSIPIPTSLPLGAMVSLTITKQNYFRYEELLEVVDPLTANFMADLTTNCPNEPINFTDLSLGDPTSWLWTFEGGTPGTSTDQNPQGIVYTGTGNFDVTLQVTGITGTNTFVNEDYITIMDNIQPTVSIVESINDICQGDEVEFTAAATYGGSNPAYQWKINGNNVGSGGTTFVTTELEDDDIVECELTSSYSCTSQNPVLSNAIVMEVGSTLPVSVTIESDTSTTICEGTQVIFNAIPENGGDNPTYQWIKNGMECGTNDPYYVTSLLQNGDVIWCKLISSEICVDVDSAFSNEITMTVINEPAQLATPEGPTYIDIQSVQASAYSTDSDTIVSDYTWTVEPESAWQSMNASDNEMEVIWAPDYMGEANVSVQGSNMCGTGQESESLVVVLDNTTAIEDAAGVELSVYPNPNSGIFKLKLTSRGMENISIGIRNMIGETIFSEEQLAVDGEIIRTFNLEGYAEGIYFLVIDNGKYTRTEKIILQK